MPHLTLATPPEGVSVTDLGSTAPTRHLGYVTTPALAQTLPVRALIRELRAAHAR
ncbi:hypothetical protein LO763_08455 [Glycomyces sp. A-F 0318]|uniref:hypothetical protein n=1 Tax=Glycomyces amatae TaxID=2881355 RepID=UPI001E5794CC|nr:hypothetical protein [Glycomyces amatae]MCD0443654.1 hypothetical protein [Glycomyces amatae]